MSVMIVVRELPEVKERLEAEAHEAGFDYLSDYVRTFWEHLQDE